MIGSSLLRVGGTRDRALVKWICYRNNGGENGLREATDVMIDLLGNGKKVLDNRVGFTSDYQNYLAERQALVPKVVRKE